MAPKKGNKSFPVGLDLKTFRFLREINNCWPMVLGNLPATEKEY